MSCHFSSFRGILASFETRTIEVRVRGSGSYLGPDEYRSLFVSLAYRTSASPLNSVLHLKARPPDIMHSYRGRTGPSRSTPANVQCQKCLKRDKSLAPAPCSFFCNKLTFLERHYSYECKAAPQERPYAARPSRSQQLRNPKLVPKLTEATPDEVERK